MENYAHYPYGHTKLVEELLKGEVDLYAVATGAGASIQHFFWSPPGASSFLTGAHFPYKQHETIDFLGFNPKASSDGFCSEATAVDLATEAYIRARSSSFFDYEEAPKPAVGFAVTASVASREIHKGPHRAHFAIVSDLGEPVTETLVLDKGAGLGARAYDESRVTEAALVFLEKFFLDRDSLKDQRYGQLRERIFSRPFFHAAGHRGDVGDHARKELVFFPGAFNPIHDGHRAMVRAVEERTGASTVYTICVDHPHKPPLSTMDILSRAANFRAERIRHSMSHFPLRGETHLLFTQGDPLFIDKVQRYRWARWIIGADTLARILDPQWGPTTEEVLQKLDNFANRFYVFPCLETADGSFLSADHVKKRYRIEDKKEIFWTMPDDIPHVRSSQIRRAQEAGGKEKP